MYISKSPHSSTLKQSLASHASNTEKCCQILIVGPEDQFRDDLISHCHEKLGWQATAISDISAAYKLAATMPLDAIVMEFSKDLVHLDQRTTEITMMREASKVPIVIVSQYCDLRHIVGALDSGADGFFAKPVEVEVVAAKLKASIKRSRNASFTDTTHQITDRLKIDLIKRKLFFDNEYVPIGSHQFKILEKLVHYRGAFVTKEEVSASIGSATDNPDNVIGAQICHIRNKIDALYDCKGWGLNIIETRPLKGVRMRRYDELQGPA